MTIEIKEKGSREFYQEVVNVVSQYRYLIKKPEMKLRDNFRWLRRNIIICAVLLVLLLAMGAAWGTDKLMIAAIALMAVTILFCGAFLMGLNKMVRNYLSDNRPSVVTLDEEGVELNKEGAQVVRLMWDNVAFVRAFSESVCFLSADLTGFVLSVTKEYRDDILDYIRNNDINVRVVS